MATLIRIVHGGFKTRYTDDGYNLDLTYITPRIIAMAYPGEGFESIYRNDISDVVEFLESKHGSNYLIINVSNRKYDYAKFAGQINDYEWPNHNSPALEVLFRICQDAQNFRQKNPNNVVVFHCNHGKGRTGTAIICFMLYCGLYEESKKGLELYNEKRFSASFYRVRIPCQIRYMTYFDQVLKNQIDFEKLKKPLKLVKVDTRKLGSHGKKYLRIRRVKGDLELFKEISIDQKSLPVESSVPFIGDYSMEIYERSLLLKDSKVGRINFHTYFAQTVESEGPKKYFLQFDGQNCKVDWSYRNIHIKLTFQQMEDFGGQKDKTQKLIASEVHQWNQIQETLQNRN